MANDNDNKVTAFGVTTFRNKARRFGIKTDDRRRHMYFIGKTGMGKSTILENMIIEDIRVGHGVAVVDPHGDLAEKIIEYIPDERVNDVIYFNPSDMEYPFAFNVVEQVEPHLRHLVASGLIGVFQKLWADSWGPRLEYILRNAILAILDYPGSTLLAVTRMLSDKAFRKKVIEKIQDPVVKAFWVNEFASYADKFASEAVSPIQNKVGQFLSSSLIRNMVGQVKSSIDIREVMDDKKILILNLSKGRIGEDNSSLLGAMMITKIQLAAMSRVDIPEKERNDFYLYIDEFQNFSTDSFANILSEARKYRLNLIMAHQYIEQLSEKVKPAVFGNVGTLIVFRVGSIDAEELVKEFTPTFTEEDIVNLPKYDFYLKLMIDGVTSNPFSGRGLPPLTNEEKTYNTDKVIRNSRERYAKDRKTVEEKIMSWHEFEGGEAEADTANKPGGGQRDFLRGDNPERHGKSYQQNREARPRGNQPPRDTGRPVDNQPLRDFQAPKPNQQFPRDSARPSIPINEQRPVENNFQRAAVQPPAPVQNKPAETFSQFEQLKHPVMAPGHAAQAAAPTPQPEPARTTAPRSNQPKKDGVYKYDAVCSRCSKPTVLAFQPDGVRPVYCKECLAIMREEKNREQESRRQSKIAELNKIAMIEASSVEATEPDADGFISLKQLARMGQLPKFPVAAPTQPVSAQPAGIRQAPAASAPQPQAPRPEKNPVPPQRTIHANPQNPANLSGEMHNGEEIVFE